ncbi:DUF898 family protein [Aquabacterium sp.]|uniref:DUF898 family protein n=1 Tax=Aquabacterium sp. TaxID=1872578 RepID=UPI0025C3B43D|nr:DUF898 family protein [Aquabacterium sp.]
MNRSGARSPARALRLTPVGRWSSALKAVGAALSVQAVPDRPAQAWNWPDPIGSRRAAGAGASSEHPGHAPDAGAGAPAPAPTVPPVLTQAVPWRAAEALPRLPNGAIDTWPVAFTGADAAYARLWFQGLLLTLLTLGGYLPWARIACRRYLLQHTRVAGQPLDDHRSPWAMLVRQCLLLSLLGGVMLAAAGSLVMGLAAATLALAVWPMLKLLGLSQRLQRTTWARRPMAFEAGLLDIYQALGWPLAGVALLVWSWLAVAGWGHAAGWVLWGMALGGCLLAVPSWCWAWLHFRQSHLRLGPLRMRWRLGPDALSNLMLQTLGAALLLLVFNLGLAGMCLGGLLWWQAEVGQGAGLAAGRAAGVPAWALAVLLAASVGVAVGLVWPQAHARAHKLVWNRTGNRHVRVRCRLRVPAIVRMQRRHGLLLVLTLGLYWPWAEIQARRARLNATVLQARVGVAVLAAHWPVK